MSRKRLGHTKSDKEELPATWKAGEPPKVCTSCDFVDNKGFSILVHPDVWAAAFYLCKEIKTEWQMLLSGSVVGQDVRITGYYIPKQEVTASTVKNLEAIDKEFIEARDIVATIHSHADMGVFFSSVDDEHTNMNFINHHMVINNKHEIVAKSRYDLRCGGVKFVDSTVDTLVPSVTEVTGRDNITKTNFNTVGNDHGWSVWPKYSGRENVMPSRVWNSHKQEFGEWIGGIWVPETPVHYDDDYVPHWLQEEIWEKNSQGVYTRKDRISTK